MTMHSNVSERKTQKSEFQQQEITPVEDSLFPWWRGTVIGILISFLLAVFLWFYCQWLFAPIHQNPSTQPISGNRIQQSVTILRDDASLKTQSGFIYPQGFDIGDPLPVGYEGVSLPATSPEQQKEIKKLLEQTGEELPEKYISE